MDMILKTTDLCKNFKGQIAVNKKANLRDLYLDVYSCGSSSMPL